MTSKEEDEKLKQLFALHTDPEFPGRVFIEYGGPEHMARYYEQEPDREYNWYGVLDDARFTRLRLSFGETEDDRNVYLWTHIEIVYPLNSGMWSKFPGDLFAKHVMNTETEGAKGTLTSLAAEPTTFQDLYSRDISTLWRMCDAKHIRFYLTQSRGQLALMLAAPVPQEPQCPSCGASVAIAHKDNCGIAICTRTGKPRAECLTGPEGHDYCGTDRWNGYERGVLESFVYSVSPEEIIAKGTWDRIDRMYRYAPDEKISQEVDETVIEPVEHTDEELKTNVDQMLKALGEKAKKNAIEDQGTKGAAEALGMEIEKE